MTLYTRFQGIPETLEPDNNLTLKTLLTAHDSGGALSITWVSLHGPHRRLRHHRCFRSYVVLTGSMELRVDGFENVTLESGDSATVPTGRVYDLSGTCEYLVINSPGYAEGDDEYE
ncbi:MAG: hypothetical protein J0I11_03595 [Actinobacteria bacterium]|nr:hypothetical protein [Actinomycetota bacterium]